MARSRTFVRGVLAASVVGAAVAALPASGSAATVDVHVGDFTPKYAAVHTAFYPNRVVIRRGDKVKFHFRGFDTATFVPRGKRLPALIVPAGGLNPATNDSAGNPYWWGGTTPVLGINPLAAGPSATAKVTGKVFVNSGLPSGPNFSFTAEFPRAGAFVVRSIVHPRMRATVVVLPTSSKAKGQTKKQITALAARQKKANVAAAKRLAATKAPKGTVLVGPGNNNVAIFGYAPAKATVKAGSTLTFRMAGRNENHTVTFGREPKLTDLAKSFEGPAPAAEALFPSDPPGSIPAVTGSSHGDGFVNSGVMADPGMPGGLPSRFTVSFPDQGDYSYLCLIHPDMKGTVAVTP